MFKINDKTPERSSLWCLIAKFEHISYLFLVFLLLTLNGCMFAGQVSKTKQ